MTMKVHSTRAVTVAAGAGAVGWWLASAGAAQAAAPMTLDSVVTAGILLGGSAAALGVCVLTCAAVIESLLGWRPRAMLALPTPLRRLLVGSVAAVMVAGIAVPAHAEEAHPGWAPAPSASPSPSTEPVPSTSPTPIASPAPISSPALEPSTDLPQPAVVDEPVLELHAESFAGPLDATNQPPATANTPPGRDHTTGEQSPGTHLVVRGDSLWRITAQLLGPDATDFAIASAWPVIYQANLSVIGDDPGLILPGQLLTIPQEVAA